MLKRFSSMPIDQAHEQNNELVKGSGGAVGLTQNPVAFRRWMVAGPEQLRIPQKYEDICFLNWKSLIINSMNKGLLARKDSRNKSQNIFQVMEDMGNPFTDDCSELLVLDTRNCTADAVATTVMMIKDDGREQYQKYFKDVIVDRKSSIHDPLR